MANQRIELLKRLRDCINEREGTDLTLSQVSIYIGDLMTLESLENWVIETEHNKNPVTARAVLEACDINKNKDFVFLA